LVESWRRQASHASLDPWRDGNCRDDKQREADDSELPGRHYANAWLGRRAKDNG
jgi:hypothetical protein